MESSLRLFTLLHAASLQNTARDCVDNRSQNAINTLKLLRIQRASSTKKAMSRNATKAGKIVVKARMRTLATTLFSRVVVLPDCIACSMCRYDGSFSVYIA